jgi:hypothetical protein
LLACEDDLQRVCAGHGGGHGRYLPRSTGGHGERRRAGRFPHVCSGVGAGLQITIIYFSFSSALWNQPL